MPEGPEIHRAANRIAKALVGKTLDSVEFHYKTIEGLEHYFLGKEVEYVKARSKGLLISVGDYVMYSHNQLYGRWTVHLKTTDPRSRRSLRAAFITDKHAVRLWSATDIVLLPTPEENGHPFLARLGPDVLDEPITSTALLQHLKSKGIHRKKGATLMLDQRSFAGLGNYLRSEILHAAGVHPDDRPCDLEEETLLRWADCIKSVTVQAYEHSGVTVDLDVAKASKERGEPRRMWRHAVFCRNDRPCLTCGDLVVRLRYGGRRLDYCPTCQPSRRPS